MRNREAVRYKQRLDNLFKQVSALPADIELQSHWAKYLCVLVSGFLETSVRAIFSQYASDKAAPYVANYVASRLKRFTNPNMDDILHLASRFNEDWGKCLESATRGELKDAVDSIVANRNLIAHGENPGITYVRIKGYYERAVTVIDLIENTCV
jgi:hypothetical protein